MIKKSVLLFLFLAGFSPAVFSNTHSAFPPAKPAKHFFVGEKLIYQIHYLGIPVGESISEIKEAPDLRGRPVYHLEVKVRSYAAIDLIYKVRDEHHSYVDKETLASLGYEKKLREGGRKVYERMEFDPVSRKARYFDEKGSLLEEIDADAETQDQLSCGYFARTLTLSEKTSIFMPVHADKRNWNLEVKIGESSPVKMKSVGKFTAAHIQPLMEFQGIFIRKGKVEGWVSLDERRIPLKMKVKIPVLGNITAELSRYEPGKES